MAGVIAVALASVGGDAMRFVPQSQDSMKSIVTQWTLTLFTIGQKHELQGGRVVMSNIWLAWVILRVRDFKLPEMKLSEVVLRDGDLRLVQVQPAMII